jgi:hypothetical protein
VELGFTAPEAARRPCDLTVSRCVKPFQFD